MEFGVGRAGLKRIVVGLKELSLIRFGLQEVG